MPMATREEQREYQRKWMAKRRAEWLATNGPCAWCGSLSNLEVDHIDPSLKVTHNVWSWRKQRRDAELAKCRVLCSDCHLKRTVAQFKKPLTHGTRNGYERHGCRCRLCTDAAVMISRIRRTMWNAGFTIKIKSP